MPAKKKFSSQEVLTKSGSVSKSRAVDATEHTVKIEDEDKPQHVLSAVSGYVIALDEEKKIKEDKEKHAKILRTFSKEVRDYFTTEEKRHLKTYRILGAEKNDFQYAVDASENDKFSHSKDKEDLKNLRKALGKEIYEELFEETTTISIKDSVMKNKKKKKELTLKLVEHFGKEGIVEYFNKDTEWVLKKGLAEKIHTYDKKIKDIIIKNLKQASDTLKDASYDL